MGFFDIFFSKKEEEVVEELTAGPQEQEIEEKPKNYQSIGICSYCEKDVKNNEKHKIIKKVLFHKKCFKKCRKEAEIAYRNN
jgi:hypothetical protein